MARLVFVQNIEYPFLGPMHISSVLKCHGHQCEALIGQRVDDFLPILEQTRPQLIGFPVMTGMHRWAREISLAVKTRLPQAVILWGGPHATFMPDVIREDGIDIVCRGEAEEAVLELANAVQAGTPYDTIANLWVKKPDGTLVRNPVRPLVENLDALPSPDRDLYGRYPNVGSATTQVFMAGRGCPFDCTFCFNHQFRELYRRKGRLVRYRSVRNVLDEIKTIRSRLDLRHVYFNDDTFILNRRWIEEFTDAYKRECPLPFTCLIRADLASEDVIRRLAEAGCRSVFFGIETGNEARRTGLLKKRLTDAQIVETARCLRKHEIKFRTYNILGLPGETLQDAFQTVEMNIRVRASYPWAAIFMPYPGTELGDQSKRMGLLDPRFGADAVDVTFHSASSLRIEHRREIENLHKFFQTAVLMPWTIPVIRRLIRLPPNRLFVLWFTLVYGLLYIRSENRGWRETVAFGLKNLAHLAPALRRRP
jgi:anaerobic magnesium-protoporphyrin IX monomethyl ester cyclase